MNNDQVQFGNKSTIILRSSKDNKSYKTFKEMIEKPDVKEKLDGLLQVFEDTTSENPEEFMLYMYGPSGQLMIKLTEFENFDEIIKLLGSSDNKKSEEVKIGSNNQRGGKAKFKHKYLKYKKKYMEIKDVITDFNCDFDCYENE